MYKALTPGAIGLNVRFKDAAVPAAKAGFEGYWFNIGADGALLTAGETNELLAKTGLKAAGFDLPVEFRRDEATFKESLAKLHDCAKYAVEIGAKRCATWLSPSSAEVSYEDNFAFHARRLRKVCEVLEEYGILCGLEFVGTPSARAGAKHLFMYNLDRMLDLCSAIGTSNCGLLLDSWHWDMAGQTSADFAKFTAGQVALVHINDAPAGIPIDQQQDGVRTLPGETGVLRIAEFLGGLKKLGYDGPVLVEPFEKKLAGMNLEETLEVVMASINKVWPK